MKNNRKSVEWFLQTELPELRRNHLISEESLDALERYYGELAREPAETGKLVTSILYCIGAAFVMLGISLILAYNWDGFSNGVRLGLGFFPLIAGAVFGFYVLVKAKGPAWREPAGIIYGLGIASALAVTTQIYYLGGELSDFMQMWFCLLILVPFIFRSFGALVLTLAVAVFWNCSDWRNPDLLLHGTLLLLPGALLIGWMFRKADSAAGIWCRYLLIPYALFYCMPFLSRHGASAEIMLWLLMSGMLCVLGCRIRQDHPFGFFRNPLPGAGFACGYFLLMALCSEAAPGMVGRLISSRDLPCFAVMLLPLAGILWCTLRKPRNWFCLLPLLPVGAVLLRIGGSDGFRIVMTFVTLLLMTVLFVLGARRNSLSSLNAAMLLIIGLIFVWFLESDFSMLTRGITFIVVGLVFVGVNVTILKLRKKGGFTHA